jgi:hypothetical protein
MSKRDEITEKIKQLRAELESQQRIGGAATIDMLFDLFEIVEAMHFNVKRVPPSVENVDMS